MNTATLKPKLFIDKYKASGGTEYFLSFEDAHRHIVFAFCRLRVDKNGLYPAFIRELHTYGQSLTLQHKNIHPVKSGLWPELAAGELFNGVKTQKHAQHRGLGKKLMAEVEKNCKKNRIPKLAVISGTGVRDYYRKLGYKLENTYMVKKI